MKEYNFFHTANENRHAPPPRPTNPAPGHRRLAPRTRAGARRPGTFPEPGKPIRLVVPFPAGGTSDLRARQVAEHLRQDAGLDGGGGQTGPGASGMIGSDLVAKAPADGYTLLLGTIGTLAINPAVFPAQPYNVLHDFQPVTQFSRSVSVLMAHRNSGITSLAQLEGRRARRQNRWAYASTGTGTIGAHGR
jgi:tripartite-type tricarboxylate transporter receptor subunit TctC